MTSIENRVDTCNAPVAEEPQRADHAIRVLLLAILFLGLGFVWFARVWDVQGSYGFCVTDVTTHRTWVETPWSEQAQYRPSFLRASGVFFLYRYVGGGNVVGYHIVNTALLLLGTWAAMNVFRGGSRLQRGVAGAAVACNPFLWLVSTGPNWEIPLVAVVALATLLPLRLSTIAPHVLLVVAAGMLKDGAGPILLMWMALRALTPRYGWLPFVVASLAIATLATSWGVLGQMWDQTTRITGSLTAILRDYPDSAMAKWSERGLNEPFIGLAMFGVRWAANAVSAPVRSPLLSEGGLPFVTGLGLALNGVFTAVAMVGATFALVADGRDRRRPSVQTMLVLFWATCIAAGVLFVQPRYLLPIVPIGCGLAAATRPRLVWSMILVGATCLSLWILCERLGMPLPRATVAAAPVHFDRGSEVVE